MSCGHGRAVARKRDRGQSASAGAINVSGLVARHASCLFCGQIPTLIIETSDIPPRACMTVVSLSFLVLSVARPTQVSA
jgi:hypothetical protein